MSSLSKNLPAWIRRRGYRDFAFEFDGGFSRIFTAKRGLRGEIVAIKVVAIKGVTNKTLCSWRRDLLDGIVPSDETRPGSLGKQDVEREIDIMNNLADNNFIVKLLDTLDFNHKIWIVMEHCASGNLRHIASVSNIFRKENLIHRCYPIKIVRHLMAPIFLAVKYMNEKHIIHKDIKDDNILLTSEGIPKLCDFGLAEKFTTLPIKPQIEDTAKDLFTGTPLYAPPEMYNNTEYDMRIDVWSLIITMLSLMYGGEPFRFTNSSARNPKDIEELYKGEFVELIEEFGEEAAHRGFFMTLALDVGNRDDAFPTPEEKAERAKFREFAKKSLRFKYIDRPTVAELCEHSYLSGTISAWTNLMAGVEENDAEFCEARRFVIDEVIKDTNEEYNRRGYN